MLSYFGFCVFTKRLLSDRLANEVRLTSRDYFLIKEANTTDMSDKSHSVWPSSITISRKGWTVHEKNFSINADESTFLSKEKSISFILLNDPSPVLYITHKASENTTPANNGTYSHICLPYYELRNALINWWPLRDTSLCNRQLKESLSCVTSFHLSLLSLPTFLEIRDLLSESSFDLLFCRLFCRLFVFWNSETAFLA